MLRRQAGTEVTNAVSKNLGKMAFWTVEKGLRAGSGRKGPSKTLGKMDIFEVDSVRKKLGFLKSHPEFAPLGADCPIFNRTKRRRALFGAPWIINIIRKGAPKSARLHFAWKFPGEAPLEARIPGATGAFTL